MNNLKKRKICFDHIFGTIAKVLDCFQRSDTRFF